MGCPHSVLPEFLLRHTQVNGVLSNTGKETDKDNLCLFRAMVLNMKGHKDCNSHTSLPSWSRNFSMRTFDVHECYVAKHIAAITTIQTNSKSVKKD